MEENLLTFRDVESMPGIQSVKFSIGALYSGDKRREEFRRRFEEFKNAQPDYSSIFELRGDLVSYQTESIIPTESDKRPPLLLVFGNPASHSVASGMFFSFEGKKGQEKEHRIWNMLSKAGILSFPALAGVKPIDKANRLRKAALYELSYCSPFRIGLAVFYSMPSPSSGARWSGVAGLRRLFRKEALTRIRECEERRIDGIIRKFVSRGGAVITFQKDAYSAITDESYKLQMAKEGDPGANWHCSSHIKVFCHPPTRLRDPSRLEAIRKWILYASV